MSQKINNSKIDLKKLNKIRTYISDITPKEDNKEVTVVGWIYDSRNLGNIKFALLRDITGEIQITGFKGGVIESILNQLTKTNRESVVLIRGIVKKNTRAPEGREIIPKEFEVLSEAQDPLPIDVSDFSKTELPKRLDYRYVDLHRKKIQAIFKIQSTLLNSFREYMCENKGIECIFPSIISSSSEGGTELYPLKYFEKNAYLSQSCQLYKQMLACSMEKVFAVFPVWRAEKHNTIRHLNESRQFDFEMAFADDFVAMNELENVIKFMVKKVLEKNEKELKELKIENLKIPESKYITFKEANELLKKNKIKTEEKDLTGEGERKLCEIYSGKIIFVHDWPLEGKPFYIMPKEDGLSRGFDALYNGMEISSGGQRIHIPELLKERIKSKGLKPEDFESYINSFKYGAPPHAGWGLGVERLTMVILGLQNIREAVLFPRDRDRLSP